jgi:hypothetical protein
MAMLQYSNFNYFLKTEVFSLGDGYLSVLEKQMLCLGGDQNITPKNFLYSKLGK